jgi:hypothetical protein
MRAAVERQPPILAADQMANRRKELGGTKSLNPMHAKSKIRRPFISFIRAKLTRSTNSSQSIT